MLPTTVDQVIDRYQELHDRERDQLREAAGRWAVLGYVRGLLFLAGLLLLALGFAQAYGLGWLWYTSGGLALVVFVGVAIYHEGLQSRIQRGQLLMRMHAESLARCRRQWDRIQVPPVEVPAWFAATSKDLDLLGSASVYKLLGVTRTPLGTETLRSWIMQGALDDEIQARQQAVEELRPEFDWRLQFRLLCEQLAASQSGPSRFVHWCESPSWFVGRRWVLGLARITSLVALAMLLGTLTTLVPLTISGPILLLVAAINFGLSVAKAGAIHDVLNQVSSRSNDAARYVQLFDMVAEYPAKSAKLQSLQRRLRRDGEGAQARMQQLGLLIWLANLRRNGIFFIVYMVLEFLFFWDAHMLALLENWKARHGAQARGWFTDLGEIEALAALAKLAADQPQWVFPVVRSVDSEASDQAVLTGHQVGHPLLDESRVANDVQIGPPGTVLLVTGSNMSGKSTLLRSIGVNVVLAQMGSVVCARSLELPPLRIETSMRIADSLADGVSFFMAELKRLKEIVDTATKHADQAPRRLLFLLDEILQGTNSRERQIAVSRVVRRLIDQRAIGAISTHDLDLAHTPELAEACQTVHFSEQFVKREGREVMTFDYRMKPGIAATTNALKLLELVGLGESPTPPPEVSGTAPPTA